ncbi:DNA gyrase subunit A, chloroplastic/mitochondrial [Dendrobium catenatum]|nr:DNA gyrase subunit A, chloroplastic/mitochondrial [Dendrobium catenatum]
MALSSMLRLTSSSLARFRPIFSASGHCPCCGFSELRFLSTGLPRRIPVLKARRRDKEETKEGKVEDEGGNGTLLVKDSSGRGVWDGKIVATELHKEAKEAYMAYAMSVLLGRALPDVRDGLKPVHRRILYAMHELGLSSRKPFRKCARVVGEVLGKFHPHGDTAVYESLVRMAQVDIQSFYTSTFFLGGDFYKQFFALTQDDSVIEHRQRFEYVARQLNRLFETVLEGNLMKGLKPKIQAAVRVMRPRDFVEDLTLGTLWETPKEKTVSGKPGDNFKKITEIELQEKRTKEIYFRCDERYTPGHIYKALTEAMLLMDLEQNTVDFVPNFDNSQKEPSLLPARVPTLLLNGSSGIAVGMATNIPPHNLCELVDALTMLIHNPDASLQELLEYMPGPDFPTGGLIMGNIGILEAYRSGRGRIIIRGKTEVESLDEKTKRIAIIIKEIPYQTNKAALVEKIAELVEDKIGIPNFVSLFRSGLNHIQAAYPVDFLAAAIVLQLMLMFLAGKIQVSFGSSGFKIVQDLSTEPTFQLLVSRVGMATNIPPHNLCELVDALTMLIHNPDASLQELLEYMPGPDFPTGGLIMGNIGILEAYRSGRGRIIIRGKTEVESLDEKTKRIAIIIKEIPYQTNKAALVEKIAELVEDKILDGISDIRDESDRTGMRVVIELKRGSDPAIVLNNLYRLTALQSSFSCNMVGILDGQPKLMGLKELLQAFLDFRCSVIERRAGFQLSQAKERKHVVEGIIIGLDNLDGVIRTIRETSNNAMALTTLMKKYSLSQKQAEALLDITLRKLTLLERKKFVHESESLSEQISKLNELLSNKKNILKLIVQEAHELKSRFGTPRSSLLEDGDGSQLEEIDVIPNEEMLLTLSEKGYVKRMKPNTFNLQRRGTIGKSVGKMRVNDSMSDFIVCHTHDRILYFSDHGIVYSAPAYRIPECSRTAAGTPLVQLLSLTEGERITSIIPVSEFAEDQYLIMLTVKGYIKKVSLNVFSTIRATGIIAIQLTPGDELKWVRHCAHDDLVAIASQSGMVTICSCNLLRVLGRKTRGVNSMRLKEGDKVASMDIIPSGMRKDFPRASDIPGSRGRDISPPWLLFLSESGHGKRVPLSEFRLSRFRSVGLIGYKLQTDDRLAAMFVVGYSLEEDGESDEQIVLVSQSGTVNRIKVRDISIQSRYARGVILMRLEHAGKIKSASLIAASAPEEAELED